MQPGTQSGSVLDRILDARRASIDHRKRVLPEAVLKMSVKKAAPVRDFGAAITRGGVNVIAELKKASPSRGVLREDFRVEDLAQSFEHAGAAALSVLTEEEFFQGSLKNMRDARKKVEIPVLRKDFIIDPWQVWETRATDGDSFLLIVAALSDAALVELLLLGRELGMEPLVEVHSREELHRALAAGAKILGVNNRDLRTLEVRLETSFELIEAIPDECTAVCESGIKDASQISALRKAGFDAFLVGEHLMTQPDPADGLLKLMAAA
jgi:indole-3-glycerol phosphate synthase